MSFDRTRLPDPQTYYESLGLSFREPKGKWRTARCDFHGGSDSLRINTDTGAWVCMAGCGARGGDVLAYHIATHGLDFITAAKELGAWVDDGKPSSTRPTPLPVRDALTVIAAEANLVAIAAANVAHGVALTQVDLSRLVMASGRIARIAEIFT